MFILKNENFNLKVNSKGAEVSSFFSKQLNKELLWQADKEVWARHAPVLFPIVGKLKNNTYIYKGATYTLPQHGFARDCDFELMEQSESSLVFELNENAETLKNYPFRFSLKIKYQLKPHGFSCTYLVSNPDTAPLYFSVGAHPGFNCPLFENEKTEDYRLVFEEEDFIERHLIQEGLISQQTEKILLKNKTLPLQTALFDKDAIVLKNLSSRSLKLQSNNYCLQFAWFNMPYYGIWTKPGSSGFICLEPWAGIADGTNTNGNLVDKEGIICLNKKEEHECGFSVEIKL